jgi:hypothetical protein
MGRYAFVPNLCFVIAVVLFAVGGVLWVASDAANPVEADTTWVLLFGGLTAFAAGHLGSYFVDR